MPRENPPTSQPPAQRLSDRKVRRFKARVVGQLRRRDMTMGQLAHATGYAFRRLSQLLGSSSLTQQEYEAICVALGIRPGDWLE